MEYMKQDIAYAAILFPLKMGGKSEMFGSTRGINKEPRVA